MSNTATWEIDGRRVLGTIEEERAAKVRSLRTEIPLLKEEFARTIDHRPADREFVVECINFAEGIKYTKSGLGSAYLSHPLRVAEYLIRAIPDVSRDYVAVAVLHNVPETSAVTLDEIGRRFGPAIANGIGTLLVDRTVPFESIAEAYYERIYAAGAEITLTKVFDKLDNLLVLGANGDLGVRTRYMDEVRRKLLPWCHSYNSGLGRYLEDLLVETERRGFDPETNAIIQALRKK